jgi:hypothetical protein
MTFGLLLNWHCNPVADVSNPLVCMHKKSPYMQVAENSRIKEPDSGNGKMSYEATRKKGVPRVNQRHYYL